MVTKVKASLGGDHVHARVFAGPHADALGQAGLLTFRLDEYLRFRNILVIGGFTSMEDLRVEESSELRAAIDEEGRRQERIVGERTAGLDRHLEGDRADG